MRLLPPYPPHPSSSTGSGGAPDPRQGAARVVGLLLSRFRALGLGQLCASRDAKSGLGLGGHGGDAGGLGAAPGRTGTPQALGARETARAGTLLLRPGPHLSGHPPRSPLRAGDSGFGRGACARLPRTFAPPPLAAGRGRGRGRLRSGPEGRRSAPPRLHGNECAFIHWSCQGRSPPRTFLLPTNYWVAEGD